MRHLLSTFALVGALALTGCGDEPDDIGTSGATSPTTSPTASDSSATASPDAGSDPPPSGSSGASAAAATTVPITIQGDTVTPNGERIEVAVGEPIALEITSDRAGELHVHSSPEQELAYEEGTSTVQLTLDRPGVVDVEDHVTDTVVLQLGVR